MRSGHDYDLLLKNTASENEIKCYTTPEFAAYQ
jgi:hypothetical protein